MDAKFGLIAGATLVAIAVTGCATGRTAHKTDSLQAGRYSHLMHNRFYEAWIPPKTVSSPRGKISVPVDVRIDRTGRVLNFKIVKRSGDEKIDNSIAAVGETIRQVTPPPLSPSQRRFALRIYFELDVKP